MKKPLNFAVIFIISILLIEILLYLIFYSPIRLYYPLGKEKVDIQTDFNVIYNVDWRTGNRLIKCNNRKNKDQKVVFIGDSFTFGQGLKASAKAAGITRAASGTKDAATMAMKTIALLKKKKKK